jgi:hypothetical protein
MLDLHVKCVMHVLGNKRHPKVKCSESCVGCEAFKGIESQTGYANCTVNANISEATQLPNYTLDIGNDLVKLFPKQIQCPRFPEEDYLVYADTCLNCEFFDRLYFIGSEAKKTKIVCGHPKLKANRDVLNVKMQSIKEPDYCKMERYL